MLCRGIFQYNNVLECLQLLFYTDVPEFENHTSNSYLKSEFCLR